MKWSLLLQLGTILLPWPIRKFCLTKLLGYHIAPTAHIGRSLVLCREVHLEHGARIGNFSLINRLELLHMETSSYIGNLNYVYGYSQNESFLHVKDRKSALLLGNKSAISARHLIDCTDTVKIGEFTTVGGFKSVFLTHSLDLKLSRQNCSPIHIGDYCFVGTNVVVMGGAVVGDRSVVGAGAVVLKGQYNPGKILAGVPAKEISDADDDWAYFHRESGFVV